MTIGIGLTTFNRPLFFKQSVKSGIDYILDKVDYFFVYNDGSDEENTKEYEKIYKTLPEKIQVIHNSKNNGVGYAKNRLLEKMIEVGCDHLIIWEDDILIKSDKAITGYIEAATTSGLEHLNFAWHGKGNRGGALYKDDVISYHKECIGAFSYYSRHALKELKKKEEAEGYKYAGLMDEKMVNAWEHVHLTKRLGDMGFTSPFWLFADATGSEEWLEEIPGSIEESAIRNRSDWDENIKRGMERWKSLDGKGIPLQE